ncbi:MAG: glycoside hydrolase family 18 [Mangrovibacterium sp.]
MRSKILYSIPLLLFAASLISGCDTDTEAEDILLLYTYDEQYFKDLRAYKESDHSIAYVWFADYNKSTSLANRFAGLPDSVDICSLWGGIPSPDVNPLAYEEMRFVQNVKGMKLVIPTIVRIEDEVHYGEEEFYRLFQESYVVQEGETEEQRLEKRHQAIEMYADHLLKEIWDHDLDGLDLDYEPEGDRLSGANFTYFVQYLGGIIGPQSENPDKLLIVDFYSNYPNAETESYVNYFVRQAYTQGFTEHSAARLQSYYNGLNWCPPHKFVVTENIGDHWRTGGSPFTEADGNTLTPEGERLYSLEGMARWNPTQGKKGGFGAFYVQRDYNSTPPYKYLRRAIQAQNPAVK